MLQLISFSNNLLKIVSTHVISLFQFPSFEYASAFIIIGNKR